RREKAQIQPLELKRCGVKGHCADEQSVVGKETEDVDERRVEGHRPFGAPRRQGVRSAGGGQIENGRGKGYHQGGDSTAQASRLMQRRNHGAYLHMPVNAVQKMSRISIRQINRRVWLATVGFTAPRLLDLPLVAALILFAWTVFAVYA